MDFILLLSNFVLENLSTSKIPDIATQALIDGYDSPSLRILAGLKDDLWEINQYFDLSLKELDIKLPSQIDAGFNLIEYYLNKIISKEIDSIEGLSKIRFEVLSKVDFFSKSKKHVYGFIEFNKLNGLFYEYDDMINPLIWVTNRYREKRKTKIKDEIFKESAKLLNNLNSIKIKCKIFN